MSKDLLTAVKKLEAQVLVRDLVLGNMFENIFGEEIANAFREALKQSDDRIDEALKDQVG